MKPSTRSPNPKLLLTAFVFATLVLLGSGFAYYQREWAGIDREKHTTLAAIATLKARQISAWRHTRQNDATRLADNILATQSSVRLLRQTNPPPEALTRLQRRLATELQHGGYHDIVLLSPEGQLLISAAAHPEPISPATQRALDDALASSRPILSDFYTAPDGIVHIDTIAAIRGADSLPLAIVVLRSLADTDLFPLIQTWPTPSTSAETVLFQREGDEVIFLNRLRHDSRPPLSVRFPVSHVKLPAVQAVLGQLGMMHGHDYRRLPVLVHALAIPNSPWFMIAKMDLAEAYADARHRTNLIALIVAALFLLLAALTGYIYRREQTKTYRALYEQEHLQRQLADTHRATLYSIGDAVITTDTGGLVRNMNPVAEKLTGWPEAEARGQPLSTIFRLIDETTRQPIETPLATVLRDNRVSSLPEHALLLARDGSTHPISDSAAPIHDENGAVTGLVLVFNDQSAQRAARAALRASEERLQRVLAGSQQGYWDWDVAASIVTFSDRWFEMLGYAPGELPQSFSTWENLLHPEDRPVALEAITAHVEGRSDRYEVEHRMRTKTGEWRWILTRGRALKRDPAGHALFVSGTHTDIDDRKRAELALREREHFLRLLGDNLWHGALYQDLTPNDGRPSRFVYLNEGATRLFGVPIAEAMADASAIRDLVHPEDRPALDAAEKESLRTLQPFNAQARILARGSSLKWIHFRSQPRRLKNGDTLWNGLAIDITKEKEAELSLQRANRALHVLSAGNEAVLRASSEQDLFVRTCHALTEIGHYRLAWIGLARDDDAKSVLPTAQAGYEQGYLEQLQVTWADAPRGRGPTGTAIRTGQPQTCRDIHNDPNFTPWRDEALKRGYASCAALPLIILGRAIGALNIYAPDPDAFDAEELRLLTSLASNLTFGILTLRLRAEAEAAEAALRANEEKFKAVFTHSPVGIALFAIPEGRLVEVNSAALAIYGYTRDEVIGRTSQDIDLWLTPQERDRFLFQFQALGHVPPTETVMRKKGGVRIPVIYSSTLVTLEGRQYSLSSIVDITERKRVEQALRVSIRDKEALLKEVHHRVKNNLQVITSLLRLEIGRIDHPLTREALGNMKDRIRSMALLHETIYRSENLARVNLADYLTQLAQQLLRTLVATPGRIALHLDLAPAHLGLDQAIPCGLLVNELLSNCLKHAFPSDRPGEIHLTLSHVKDGSLLLRVADNGVGLPSDFDQRRTHSLGVQLISDLAGQLGGSLLVEPCSPGAAFAVSFRPETAPADTSAGL